MTLTLRVLFGFDPANLGSILTQFKDSLMADVNAAIDDLKATAQAEAAQFRALAQANADALAALQAQIADLQAQIANGVDTQAIVDRLAEVKLEVSGIVPDAPTE